MKSSVLAFLSIALLSSGIHAAIYWDDELEEGNTDYDVLVTKPPCGSVPSFEYDAVNKVSGTASLKENFPSIDSMNCGGYADRYFPATDDLWGRFYIRLSRGFRVANQTKIMRNDAHANSGMNDDWWAMQSYRNLLIVAMQNYPTNGSTTNLKGIEGKDTLRADNSWNCVETRIKLNTVGTSDGLVQAWINGVLAMDHKGMTMRQVSQGTQNERYTSNRMYRQSGEGTINYDRLAFGNSRIGCDLTKDTTVPAAPSNLKAIPVSLTQIDLSWTDNANDEGGYKIEKALIPTGGWSPVAFLAENQTSFSVTGLTQNRTYYFRVRAVKPWSFSAFAETNVVMGNVGIARSEPWNARDAIGISAMGESVRFSLPNPGFHTLAIYNLSGKEVFRMAVNQTNQVEWKYGTKEKAGVYFVKLVSGKSSHLRKFLVVP